MVRKDGGESGLPRPNGLAMTKKRAPRNDER